MVECRKLQHGFQSSRRSPAQDCLLSLQESLPASCCTQNQTVVGCLIAAKGPRGRLHGLLHLSPRPDWPLAGSVHHPQQQQLAGLSLHWQASDRAGGC
jgi:hypothetical protein